MIRESPSSFLAGETGLSGSVLLLVNLHSSSNFQASTRDARRFMWLSKIRSTLRTHQTHIGWEFSYYLRVDFEAASGGPVKGFRCGYAPGLWVPLGEERGTFVRTCSNHDEWNLSIFLFCSGHVFLIFASFRANRERKRTESICKYHVSIRTVTVLHQISTLLG